MFRHHGSLHFATGRELSIVLVAIPDYQKSATLHNICGLYS